MKRYIKYSIIPVICQLCISTVLCGQSSWKSWNTAQVQLSLSKRLDLRISHMRAFDVSGGFQPDFNQSAFHIGYELSKKWEAGAGFVKSANNTLTDGSNRVTARISYKTRLANMLMWTNAVQGELHSADETRYRNRVILSSRLATRKRMSFLHLMPSVSYSLFYNIGGDPIQYYDAKTGVPVVKQTPDGFHRGRLTLNINSRLSKRLSLSIYYMNQQEFNLFTTEYRKMNIIKPSTGRLVRAFDHYQVAGLSILYDIKLYSSNK